MRARREPKFTKTYRLALLVDAMGSGLCPIHGEFLGTGKYLLRACPVCDREEHFKKEEEHFKKEREEEAMKVTKQTAQAMKCLGGKLEIVASDPDPNSPAELSREYNCSNCHNEDICHKLFMTAAEGK